MCRLLISTMMNQLQWNRLFFFIQYVNTLSLNLYKVIFKPFIQIERECQRANELDYIQKCIHENIFLHHFADACHQKQTSSANNKKVQVYFVFKQSQSTQKMEILYKFSINKWEYYKHLFTTHKYNSITNTNYVSKKYLKM